MSKFASLELSIELHEVSGWYDQNGIWIRSSRNEWTTSMPYAEAHRLGFKRYWPAYDLGYLLRKLYDHSPCVRYVDADNHHAMDLKEWHGKWIAYVPYQEQGVYPFADSPEDAVAMLAIQLFKQGILTKEVIRE